jgi:hypothetical protein
VFKAASGGVCLDLQIYCAIRDKKLKSEFIMEFYSTYCCKEKTKTDNSIKSIDLYKSERIKQIYKIALKNNKKFVILSGKHGFLFPETKIRYYDKLLQPDEIKTLLPILKNFVNKNNITKITFYYRNFSVDKNVKTYYNCIKQLCNNCNIIFNPIIYK